MSVDASGSAAPDLIRAKQVLRDAERAAVAAGSGNPARPAAAGSAESTGVTGASGPADGVSSSAGPAEADGASSEGHDQASKAREIVLRKLAASAKSRAQLVEALTAKDIPEDVATAVLDRFAEVGLVDDVAFAEGWVQSRAMGRGARALRLELRRKGVAEETIDSALSSLCEADDGWEEQAAYDLATARLRGMTGLAPQARLRRIVGLLQRRGYPGDVAFRVAKDVTATELGAAEPDFAGAPGDV